MDEWNEYCPHIATCPFYKNWKEQTKKEKIDIITREGESWHYACLALIALRDPETGIPMNDELKSKLDSKQKKFECSHITLLNLL